VGVHHNEQLVQNEMRKSMKFVSYMVRKVQALVIKVIILGGLNLPQQKLSHNDKESRKVFILLTGLTENISHPID
jgi:hypothetical protein